MNWRDPSWCKWIIWWFHGAVVTPVALGPVRKPLQNVFMELNFSELSCVVFLASFSVKYKVLIVSFVSVKWHKLMFVHTHWDTHDDRLKFTIERLVFKLPIFLKEISDMFIGPVFLSWFCSFQKWQDLLLSMCFSLVFLWTQWSIPYPKTENLPCLLWGSSLGGGWRILRDKGLQLLLGFGLCFGGFLLFCLGLFSLSSPMACCVLLPSMLKERSLKMR